MSRPYNKRSYPTTIRSGIGSREIIREKIYAQRRGAMKMAPSKGTFKMRYNRFSRYTNAFAGRNETKYIDNLPCANAGVAGANVTVTTGGVILNWWPIQNGGAFGANQSLVQIPQGTTKNTRIGNKSHVVHLRGRLNFELPNNGPGDIVRCIIYEDRQCNGTATTVADVLEQASMFSFQQMDFVDQIKILWDKTFALNPPTSTGLGTAAVTYFQPKKFALKINREVHFSNTTGALTGIVSANFNILLIGFTGVTVLVGTAAGTAGSSVIRTYFKDQ